jgi:hypothetical protein
MRRPGVRIPLPPVPKAFGRVAPKVAAATEGGHLLSSLNERSELRLGKPRVRMAKFFYVYILQSDVDSERFYSGLTDDLPMRLKRHNSGQVLHMAKWKPWRLKTYVGFFLPVSGSASWKGWITNLGLTAPGL